MKPGEARLNPIGSGYRPCGACADYVTIAVGCEHWRPMLARSRNAGPESVRTQLNRRYAENARLRTAQVVAEFRRMMTRGVTG